MYRDQTMKTIGLLAGMSWESTVHYYTIINQLVNKELGGLSSAKIIMNSVNFDPIEKLQSKGDWDGLDSIMVKESLTIQNAGADLLVICTNTMHKCYHAIKNELSIPIIHIADATAHAINQKSLTKIGLLGTIYTMVQDFYKGRLIDKFNLEIITPESNDMKIVNNIIFNELVMGKILPKSKQSYQNIIAKLVNDGAEGIILGCTEIPMLIQQEDTQVPVFDTTYLHAEASVKMVLEK